MSDAIQPVRGMNDILPEQTPVWQFVERQARELLSAYGYREIRLPVVERTELFKRSIGELTDIVEKEMYTFDDRKGRSLSLRPEATAGMVRAGISNGLLHNQRHRLWCSGPMFRYEAPQEGRYRQFHQLDVEAFGFAGPDIDAELILLSARLWKKLGLDGLTLKLNSLGTPDSRLAYRRDLLHYFSAHREHLDADSKRRLEGNPLRILDSKNPAMQSIVEGAPLITESLDPESALHFDRLCKSLDEAEVSYEIDPRLVRGLDYYSRTVFEWVTDRLGAQDAVCSGGRYDGLVAQLGGRATPAIGWALGLERLVALVDKAKIAAEAPLAYLVLVGDRAALVGPSLAERLRDQLPGLGLEVHCGGGGFKAQLKKADRSGAQVAIILGDTEIETRRAAVKPLRRDEEQRDYPWEELPGIIEHFAAGRA